ncbi:MAG: hypothetical protein FJ104_11555, partial [Deltaproteobacteria bacterium]|nr:hypothetical protein [Deltaproteobacteria bacterium]
SGEVRTGGPLDAYAAVRLLGFAAGGGSTYLLYDPLATSPDSSPGDAVLVAWRDGSSLAEVTSTAASGGWTPIATDDDAVYWATYARDGSYHQDSVWRRPHVGGEAEQVVTGLHFSSFSVGADVIYVVTDSGMVAFPK